MYSNSPILLKRSPNVMKFGKHTFNMRTLGLKQEFSPKFGLFFIRIFVVEGNSIAVSC